MATERLSLDAKKREVAGKKVKVLRKEGLVPAVVYGAGVDSQNLTINSKNFIKLYKEAGASTVFELAVEGENKPLNVLIKDVDVDFLARKILHVSFYAVNMKKEIDTNVPLVLTGASQAEKDFSAVILQTIDEVPVRCLPGDLPSELGISIDVLKEIGDTVYISDLVLPKGVQLMMEEDEMKQAIVSATAPITKEQEEALNAAGSEEVETEVTEQGEDEVVAEEGEEKEAVE